MLNLLKPLRPSLLRCPMKDSGPPNSKAKPPQIYLFVLEFRGYQGVSPWRGPARAIAGGVQGEESWRGARGAAPPGNGGVDLYFLGDPLPKLKHSSKKQNFRSKLSVKTFGQNLLGPEPYTISIKASSKKETQVTRAVAILKGFFSDPRTLYNFYIPGLLAGSRARSPGGGLGGQRPPETVASICIFLVTPFQN